MYKDKTILGLIPARGGSQNLPRKNIKPLLGKPLIAWTIEQGLKSQYIDKLIVSTDNKEISEVSKQYGAEVPFMRPKELSLNETPGIQVVLHAMDWMKTNADIYDLIMFLQPTSPLRTSEDIDMAVKFFFLKKAHSVVSVCKAEHHPHWSNTLPENLNMNQFISSKILNKNRQKLPSYFRLNGSIYLSYWRYLEEKKRFFGKKTYAFIMPQEKSVDIDNKIDFKLAEIMLKEQKSKK